MSIHPSSAADVARLVTELTGGDAQRRDLAVARLAVIGPRAISPLLAIAGDPARGVAARAAAFEALEAIGDSRVLPTATSALADASEDVAIAAIGALGPGARVLAAR
ncbi:MAG: hypothetical protein NUW22_00575, partial [Acidobacteria bacterium]|nr:hypothetical protein [Acidobacteriota bacterium]